MRFSSRIAWIAFSILVAGCPEEIEKLEVEKIKSKNATQDASHNTDKLLKPSKQQQNDVSNVPPKNDQQLDPIGSLNQFKVNVLASNYHSTDIEIQWTVHQAAEYYIASLSAFRNCASPIYKSEPTVETFTTFHNVAEANYVVCVKAFLKSGQYFEAEPRDITVSFGNWERLESNSAPTNRYMEVGVWTGKKLIVWGGLSEGRFTQTGGIYDPENKTWVATSLVNAPIARGIPKSTWTGKEMIVWGGRGTNNLPLAGGGRYNPDTNTWRAISTVGSPSKRVSHSLVWTGEEIFLWGGIDYTNPSPGTYIFTLFNDGFLYKPSNDTWSNISSINAPSPRYGATSLLLGTKILVWGGRDENNLGFKDGAVYDLIDNSWEPISDAPGDIYQPCVVWNGEKMLAWSGYDRRGLIYDPLTDDWSEMSELNKPPFNHVQEGCVWTGSRLFVWGGYYPNNSEGRLYDPVTNTWEPTSVINAPQARSSYLGFWTGEQVLIWGGQLTDYRLNNNILEIFSPPLPY